MPNSSTPPWLRAFTLFLALATFFLVIAGGVLPGTQAHHLVASSVGLLTVVLAILLSRTSTASVALRRAAWTAVGLVIIQGVLGGVTAMLKQPAVTSVSHACLGHIFFGWMVCLAWFANTPQYETNPSLTPADGKLYRLAATTTGFVLLQLLAGAIFRHTGKGLHFHFLGAFLVLVHGILILKRAWTTPGASPAVRQLTVVLNAILAAQLMLGFLAWQMPSMLTQAAHQSLGAFILAVSLLITVQSTRRRIPA